MILRFQLPLADEAQIAFYKLITLKIGNVANQVQTTDYAFAAHPQYFRGVFDDPKQPYDPENFNTIDYVARDEATELWLTMNAPAGPDVSFPDDRIQHVNPAPEQT